MFPDTQVRRLKAGTPPTTANRNEKSESVPVVDGVLGREECMGLRLGETGEDAAPSRSVAR
jgi:hypothetical protein